MAHLWRCAQSPLVSFLQKDFFPIFSRLKFLMNFGPKNESNLKKVERFKHFLRFHSKKTISIPVVEVIKLFSEEI